MIYYVQQKQGHKYTTRKWDIAYVHDATIHAFDFPNRFVEKEEC